MEVERSNLLLFCIDDFLNDRLRLPNNFYWLQGQGANQVVLEHVLVNDLDLDGVQHRIEWDLDVLIEVGLLVSIFVLLRNPYEILGFVGDSEIWAHLAQWLRVDQDAASQKLNFQKQGSSIQMNSAELHFQLMKLFASILPVGGVASFDAQIVLAARIGEEFLESNARIELLRVAETDFVLIFVGDEDGLILLESELIQFGLKGAFVLDWILQTNLQENDLRIHKMMEFKSDNI